MSRSPQRGDAGNGPAFRGGARRSLRKTAAGLLSAAFLTAFAACATAPRGASEDSRMEYLETLSKLEAAGAALEPDSEEERRAVERFERLLSDFKAPDFRDRIGEVYAADVFFNDTLKTLRGVDEVEEHLAATADALEKGTVEFVDLVAEDGNYYFRWVMTVSFKRLARGEEKRSIGMTHVRFDREGKVVLHQDFWDSAGGLYEHVPVLGWMLRRAKNRL